MPLIFYPNADESLRGTPGEKLEVLLDAAERYKAIVLDAKSHLYHDDNQEGNKRLVPRELKAAYNWGETARVMREIRELSEGTPADKIKKAELLIKMAEVYEVLRGAKMSKLEAVRLALINEAKQLRGEGL